MKHYRVTIDGRVYEVEIDDPRARPVTARLSGTAYSVDIESGRAADKQEDSAAAPTDTTRARTPQGTADKPSRIDDLPETTATPPVSLDVGPQTLRAMTAPIPGVVSKVTALAGQKVERGDELLTIEAMKMFNVMRSPRSGTVATVHVKDGDRVVQGQPLVTFAT